MKLKLIKKLESHEGYMFTVIDGTFSEPRYATAVAFQNPLGERNLLTRIDDETIDFIKDKMKSYINKYRKTAQRIMLIIDISEFPFINVFVDTRDQAKELSGDNSQFAQDVIYTWSTYDNGKTIPVIIVNMNMPFTGLVECGL